MRQGNIGMKIKILKPDYLSLNLGSNFVHYMNVGKSHMCFELQFPNL